MPTWKFVRSGRALPTPSMATFPSSTHNFSGLPAEFAMGEMYGLRQWRVDLLGRLRARNVDWVGPWEEGENHAVCAQRISDGRQFKYIIDPFGKGREAEAVDYSTTDGYKVRWTDGEETQHAHLPVDRTSHRTPHDECQCGFYAYTDPGWYEVDSIRFNGLVLGVIKAYGRVLIGEAGFRAEKAQIAAIAAPKSEEILVRGAWEIERRQEFSKEMIRRHYPQVPVLRDADELMEKYPIGPR